jgi:hypothetical protein
MIVHLFTKAGACVHEQALPSYVIDPPDVIVWGDRIFCVPSIDGPVAQHVDREADEVCPYEEALVYTLDPALVGWSETREKSPR